VISSVLTARGVPGGTAARTFVEAYREPGSRLLSEICDFDLGLSLVFWFLFCCTLNGNNY